MRDLIIMGTGVHAAEMAGIIERINRARPTWKFLGHIAPKPTDAREFAGHPILGDIETLEHYPIAAIVPDNEFPRNIPLPADRLVTLIDPSCYVHSTARIGGGCVLYPFCFIGYNAVIGQRIFMLSGCCINHDDVIADQTVLASGVTLAGAVKVEEAVYLGQGCSVRQHLSIGRNSMVGMGAVVVKDVPPNCIMVGNPARKLRDK